MTDEVRVKAIALIKKLRNLADRSDGPEQVNAKSRISELMEKHAITEQELKDTPEPTDSPDKWDWEILFAQIGITPEELESLSTMRIEDFLVSTGWFSKKTDTTSTIANGVVKAGKVGAERLVQRFFASKIDKDD